MILLFSVLKMKVYVHSLELPTTGFVDMEGARHACAQAQKTAFTGLERFSNLFGNRYLSDEERGFLLRTDDFCKEHGLNLEIIDLGTVDFLRKLKLKIKGVTTPAICCGKRMIHRLPSEEDVKGITA
ncbi:hypothetical protein A3K79_02070 [Candidatus Bathyarchaeota archaeon RBG_13_46_16b]|nr:MAG: hypothetical protein A3K79_02070 [Candidatus Bathyarchaeota archaeon RBG_13_46_16b]